MLLASLMPSLSGVRWIGYLLTLLSGGCLLGCHSDGLGGRELSGRLVPEVEGSINPRTGEFYYRSGKDVSIKLKDAQFADNKVGELEIVSQASPVVTADAQIMGYIERMQERERARLEYRDLMDAYKFQAGMQALQNVVAAVAPTLVKPQVASSMTLPTPWGTLERSSTPGGPASQPAVPPPFQLANPPSPPGHAVPGPDSATTDHGLPVPSSAAPAASNATASPVAMPPSVQPPSPATPTSAASLPSTVTVKITDTDANENKGFGRLEDGSLVVVLGAADKLGQTVTADVAAVATTRAGRLITARLPEGP